MQSITLDVNAFSQQKLKVSYPNFELLEFNDTLPIVISSLESGDTPLLAHYNGQCRIVCRISLSAMNVSKLLRTQGMVVYNRDEITADNIYTVKDYLEVV